MLVEHKATIDAFVGLQFAQERQIWHTRRESGGWLVDPDPKVVPVVAAEAGVTDAARRWTTARQACDEKATSAEQAVPELFGVSAGAFSLCGSKGQATVGAPGAARPGPETADLVSQFGPSVLPFLRKVAVTGLTKGFTLFLVPIGTDWRVVAVGET